MKKGLAASLYARAERALKSRALLPFLCRIPVPYNLSMRWLWYSFLALFSLGMIALVAAVGGFVYIVSYYGKDLPDYTALKDYKPPVVTRVYAGDGRLMAEFAE